LTASLQTHNILALWHFNCIYIFASYLVKKKKKNMLDQQDLVKIEEVIDRKTSDIRQDMSILKQEIKDLRKDTTRQIQLFHEDMKHEFKLLIENLHVLAKEYTDPIRKIVVENHGPRITALEIAFKKKMA